MISLAFSLSVFAWLVGWGKARALRRRAGSGALAARPVHHGWYVAAWTGLPAIVFAALWAVIEPRLIEARVLAQPAAATLPGSSFARHAILAEARAMAMGRADLGLSPQSHTLVAPFRAAIAFYGTVGIVAALLIAIAGGTWAYLRVQPRFGARPRVERVIMLGLLGASLIAVFTTFGIVASLTFETLRFFDQVSPFDFLTGTNWSPDPMASPTLGRDHNYGALPLFWGTVYVGAVIAMLVAIPLGLMGAIYSTQYAGARMRRWIKPSLEILAGVPTVVYGYFAALSVAPLVRDFGHAIGISSASGESALAAGLVMGVMIIPLISSMADDAIASVPQALRDGSLALGATTSETIRKVIIPSALPGIVGGIMLAVSRAIGETMIVVMAAGRTAHLTANPFAAMTTVAAQIVALLTSEGTPDHPATLSAYALGFILFLVTLSLNFIALRVVKQYREAYE